MEDQHALSLVYNGVSQIDGTRERCSGCLKRMPQLAEPLSQAAQAKPPSHVVTAPKGCLQLEDAQLTEDDGSNAAGGMTALQLGRAWAFRTTAEYERFEVGVWASLLGCESL